VLCRYSPSTRDHSPAALDSHYQKTKQRLRQETNQVTLPSPLPSLYLPHQGCCVPQERQNHDHDHSLLEKRSKLFEKEKRAATSASPGRVSGQSPLRGRPAAAGGSVGGDVDDWVTCIDPKTQRKYYYSKSRKVSSWTLPTDSSVSAASPRSSSSPLPGRSRTGTGTGDSRSSTPNSSRPNSRERGYPQRAPSPTGSLTSTSSSQHTANTMTRERSNSSSLPIGGGWFEATDPQSGRTYWFNRLLIPFPPSPNPLLYLIDAHSGNRTTKQSTWKKPNLSGIE
jgi:hypothetical protein